MFMHWHNFLKLFLVHKKEQLYCTHILLRFIDDIYSEIFSHVQERLSSCLCHMDVTSQLLLKTVANVNTLLICRTLHSSLKTRPVCRSLQNSKCTKKLIYIAQRNKQDFSLIQHEQTNEYIADQDIFPYRGIFDQHSCTDII